MSIIKIGGNLLDLQTPKVMGILNLTPDSFYDGSKHNTLDNALLHVRRLWDEGVDLLDIGAASSRPGAISVKKEDEWAIIEPVLAKIREEFPDLPISIDTFQCFVAERAISKGADIINDISSGTMDDEMIPFISKAQVPYIMMHMKGKPQTMQLDPQYDDVCAEVLQFFIAKIRDLRSRGVKDLIVDPGFGFGKSISHNYKLFNKLSIFKMLECPILVGLSRKSMIYKVLDITPEESLSATSALHLQALNNGSKILRVHDVREAKEIIKLHKVLSQNN